MVKKGRNSQEEGGSSQEKSRSSKEGSANKKQKITADNAGSSNYIDEETGVVAIENGLSSDTGGELENQCCVCFCTYEEDLTEQTVFQWVQYVCKRLVHENCYEEVLTNKNGRELCPYCVL